MPHGLRTLMTALLTALWATAAAARPAHRPLAEAAPAPETKTSTQAYSALLIGTAGPILLGSALIGQGGHTNDVLGAWLIAGGIFVGPSTGQFYAQSYRSGMLSTGLRIGGVAMTLAGFLASYGGGNDGGGALLALLGFGSFLAGNVHSLIDTQLAVERYRERVQEERFGLTPTLTPAEGELRPGALAWMRF